MKLSCNKKIKILIAEDSILNQKVAQFVFAKMGFNFDLAINGLEAVQKASLVNYDLIFMDLIMPEMDGFEASISIIKNSASIKKPVIVAMTGGSSDSDIENCKNSGINDYLLKPINEAKINDILSKYNLV